MAATTKALESRRDSKRDDHRLGSAIIQDAAPKSLQEAIEELEKLFTVNTATLKKITDRFEEELYLGLARFSRCLLPSTEPEDGEGSIPMNVTYIQGWPTGHERGTFLTLELGSTDVRVCWVTLSERKGDTKVVQQVYRIPENYKEGDADPLFTFLLDSIEDFIGKRQLLKKLPKGQLIPFGFTFSFPVTQEEIDHGVLQSWTKEFDIKGIEGHDVAARFRQYLRERNLPIKLVALINDTTGAMIASRYQDPKTVIGAIFGPGCNAAYFEHCRDIPKISGLPPDQLMAINCEYGAFDNEHLVLPRTRYDIKIDDISPRPGEQAFEKMTAGMYVGELLRLCMLDLIDAGFLFQKQDTARLRKPFVLDSRFLTTVENDVKVHKEASRRVYKETAGIDAAVHELALLHGLARAIATRGARLCCCGIAAICRKKNITSGHVAADEGVAKDPNFSRRWAEALGEVLDWPAERKKDPIVITVAGDGPGVGAAVISAMAPTWPKQKDRRSSMRQSFGGAELFS